MTDGLFFPIGERVRRCLEHQSKLTMGEVEMLRAAQQRCESGEALTFLEEQEVHQIEKKLDVLP